MAKITAKQKTKDESGKKFAKKIRNQGDVPCVIYVKKRSRGIVN